MNFLITPEEALPCAEKLLEHLRGKGGKLFVEQAAWDDSPYRTTLYRTAGEELSFYEAQGHLSFHSRLQNFAQWLAAHRYSAELYLVAEEGAATTAQLFIELQRHGVGLMLLRADGSFDCSILARNPALQVTPDPALRLEAKNPEVMACVGKFNNGQRKDGLRDLCEMVERETETVLVKAVKKGWITLTEADVLSRDWSGQINALGSSNIMIEGRNSLVDSKLKDDLHSFRGARNLVDHKVRSKREEQRRQRQFAERMLMGTRLMFELTELRRRIR